MVLLYKDPDGDSVTEKSNTPCSLDSKLSTRIMTIKAESELEKIIKEKDDTIERLRSEIMMMKVCVHVWSDIANYILLAPSGSLMILWN